MCSPSTGSPKLLLRLSPLHVSSVCPARNSFTVRMLAHCTTFPGANTCNQVST